MTGVSVAMDGDSQAAMDGAKRPWIGSYETLLNGYITSTH